MLDLQDAQAKHTDEHYLLVCYHLQLVQWLYREKKNNHVGNQVDDTSNGERRDLVTTLPLGDGLVPIERKRTTDQTTGEDRRHCPSNYDRCCHISAPFHPSSWKDLKV